MLDEGTREILVLLITTSGTVAVAYIKAHPAAPAPARKDDDDDEDDEAHSLR